MPGVPLLNLGYGLGGLVQGYQNAQTQGLQQALQRLALQQAQSSQNAQNLAGLALQAGLLNQRGGGGPLQPINVSAPGSAPAAPQPAAPVAPQDPASAPQVAPQQTYTPPSPFELGDMRSAMVDQPPIYAPGPGQPDFFAAPAQQQSAPAGPPPRGLITTGTRPGVGRGTPTQFAYDAFTRGPGMPTTIAPSPQQQPAPAKSDDDQPPALPQPPLTDRSGVVREPHIRTQVDGSGGDQQPAPQSSADQQPTSGGGGGGVAAVFPNGQSIDISSMFKTIDYQQLARGIARIAPPGTSQADIYAAVTDLAKLADGDKVQQQQAGLIARTLLGGQFKLANTEMTTAAAQKRTETTVAGAGERTAAQQAGATQREREAAASRERIAEANRESREKIAEAAQQIRRDAMNIRNENDKARIAQSAQRIAQAAQNAGRAEIALQIQSISRQISTIKAQPDGSFTDLQQQQLKTFSDRIAALAAQAAQGSTPSGP